MNIESNEFFFLLLNFDFYSNYVKQYAKSPYLHIIRIMNAPKFYSGYLMSAFYTLTNTQAHKHFPRSGHLVR